jgi:hypothetical protein
VMAHVGNPTPFLHSCGRLTPVVSWEDRKCWSSSLQFREVSRPRILFDNLTFDRFVQSLILERQFLEPKLSGLSIKGLSVVPSKA